MLERDVGGGVSIRRNPFCGGWKDLDKITRSSPHQSGGGCFGLAMAHFECDFGVYGCHTPYMLTTDYYCYY